ncbi:MAG: putative ribose-5-phosphate isomerase B [Alphaproteobacteria bacterium MarineAlpha5_Bin11]|nr:ribose 5-phosphate isomerase B [Pelagibacteraceae bacterium]PPR42751.1 MAG: putative ribose-5-phosphate isomerase B [Alphaproteobacteria bacterium MarineAlpha5_Bin11]|tara:strand:+ start:256 stop:684 length:429 start_codon:yes stop_codon:yes gene_type:complete
MSKVLLIASDHAGYELKNSLIDLMGTEFFEDLGPDSDKSVDYPDYVKKLINEMKIDSNKKGILICGSGLGMSISANRYEGIRAALCSNSDMAILARKHNDANILVLPGRFIDVNTAKLCIDNFLNTNFEGGRHSRRIKKIDL